MKEILNAANEFLKGNVYVWAKGNQPLRKFLIEYALSKGVPVYRTTVANKDVASYEFHSLCWNRDTVTGGRPDAADDLISVQDFMKFCDDYQKNLPVKLQLTPAYEAVVDKQSQVVTVGCQTIPFSKVKELAALLED